MVLTKARLLGSASYRPGFVIDVWNARPWRGATADLGVVRSTGEARGQMTLRDYFLGVAEQKANWDLDKFISN